MKYAWLFVLAFGFLIVGTFSFTTNDSSTDFTAEKKNIVLRNIGHEILLSAGNSTDRVLPVKYKGKGEYIISFEPEFAIHPDSMVEITKRNLSRSDFPKEYVINLRSCESQEVVFGNYVSVIPYNDINACGGRLLPADCYLIQLKFDEEVHMAQAANWQRPTAMALATMTFLLGVWRIRKNKTNEEVEEAENPSAASQLAIGSATIFLDEQYLVIGNEKIEITEKETQLLQLLAINANKVVEKSELREKIWGDEGVMISRSLDMFISKLRKKIKSADDLEIVNVRGKGWILKVSS